MSTFRACWAGPSELCPRAVGRSLRVLWQSRSRAPRGAAERPRTLVMRCAFCSVLQTLVIKVCGVILSVVGGLAVGKVMCTGLSRARCRRGVTRCGAAWRWGLALVAPR